MAHKINLRRAAALQTTLLDTIRSIKIETNIRLNEWQDPAQALQEGNTQLLANDARRNDLLMSLYSIRAQVGVNNAASGVSQKLSHMAYIDKRVAQLTEMIDGVERVETVEVIAGRLEKIRNRPADSRASLYGHHDEVTSSVLTNEQIEGIRGIVRDLKKQKTSLNDEVLELNVRTEIELSADVEAVLVREGLI